MVTGGTGGLEGADRGCWLGPRWLLGWDRGGCWQIVAETEVGDRGRDRGGRSKPRPRWARMEETETEVVTGGADRGHLEQIEP